MVRKSILSLLVIVAIFLTGCASAGTGEDVNGVGENSNDVAVTGIPADDANANDFNTNDGNANDLNVNDANTNDMNTNGANANDNMNANANDNMNANANDNMNANTNDNLNGNLNANDNLNGNLNGNENGADTNTNDNSSGAMTTTTPAVPAGTGLANPDTYDLFIQSLEAQGITATPDADFTPYTFAGFPAGRGRTLTVNGETVYVIEFQDATTAQTVYQAWQSGGLQLQDYFQGDAGADANGTGDTNANGNDTGGMGTDTNANGVSGTAQPDANMDAGDANVWSYGRILVVYFGDDAATIEMLGRMMNGAASQDGAGDVSAALPAAVMTAVQQYAAEQFQATPESVQIVSVMPVQFRDSCLGATTGDMETTDTNTDSNGNGTDANANGNATDGAGAESCAQVITPGWAVTTLINGQQYVLRVNQDGSVVRQAPEGMDQ